jgi:protein phosphatase
MPGDRVLLCSDGLTDLVSDDELHKSLSSDAFNLAIAFDLVEIALGRGAPDNVTVVVATL